MADKENKSINDEINNLKAPKTEESNSGKNECGMVCSLAEHEERAYHNMDFVYSHNQDS